MEISIPSYSEAQVEELQRLTDELLFWGTAPSQKKRAWKVEFKKCVRCDEWFSFHGSSIGHKRFCSESCRRAARNQNYKSRCEECGSIFFHDESRPDRVRRFCSLACNANSQRGSSRKCEFCATEFYSDQGKQRFCSLQCFAALTRTTIKYRLCEWCGKEIENRANKKFCGQFCYGRFQRVGGRDKE